MPMSKCVSPSCFCNVTFTIAVLVILVTQLIDESTISRPWLLIESIDSARKVLIPPLDLHPPGLQVLDLKSFSFLLNSDICGRGPVSILTMVSSALTNKAARSTIRSSWGLPSLPGARLAFLLGTTQDSKIQKQVEEEAILHGDIIQGNFVDVYRNLTYKNIMGKVWVVTFCSQAEVVVKSDDDSYIDLYAVYAITRPHIYTEAFRTGHWMMGPVKYSSPVLRSGSKWAVTNEEVDPSLKEYPPYCNSIFYVFNVATAERLVNAAKVSKYLFLDDVFVTGFLRQQLNISLQETNVFQTYSLSLLVRQKMIQSAHTYITDHINGLLERDGSYNKTCSMINRYAKWCYANRCLNNIYYPDYKPTETDISFQKIAIGKKRRRIRRNI